MRERLRRLRDVVTSRVFVRSAFLVFFVGACVQLVLFMRWAAGEGAVRAAARGGRGPAAGRALHELLRMGPRRRLGHAAAGGPRHHHRRDRRLAAVQARLLRLDLPGRHRVGAGASCSAASCSAARSASRSGSTERAGECATCSRGSSSRSSCFVPLAQAVAFRQLPYMWTADIKILTGFANPLFILAGLVAFVLSMLFSPVWCRYLCPLGGWYSRARDGVAVRRAPRRRDCASTATSARRCATRSWTWSTPGPRVGARVRRLHGLRARVPGPRGARGAVLGRWRIPAWVWPLLVVGVWLLIYGVAKLTHNWDTTITRDMFKQVINSGVLTQSSRPQWAPGRRSLPDVWYRLVHRYVHTPGRACGRRRDEGETAADDHRHDRCARRRDRRSPRRCTASAATP